MPFLRDTLKADKNVPIYEHFFDKLTSTDFPSLIFLSPNPTGPNSSQKSTIYSNYLPYFVSVIYSSIPKAWGNAKTTCSCPRKQKIVIANLVNAKFGIFQKNAEIFLLNLKYLEINSAIIF